MGFSGQQALDFGRHMAGGGGLSRLAGLRVGGWCGASDFRVEPREVLLHEFALAAEVVEAIGHGRSVFTVTERGKRGKPGGQACKCTTLRRKQKAHLAGAP